MQKQRLELLSKAISALTPKLRATVETYQLHDCSIAEVAQRNHITLAAAKSRMLRARAELQSSSLNSGAS